MNKKLVITISGITVLLSVILVFSLRYFNQKNNQVSTTPKTTEKELTTGSTKFNIEVPSEQISAQTYDYTNTQYSFKTKIPTVFYKNQGIDDGIYASSVSFSTKSGENPQLDENDVSLSIVISHSKGTASIKSLEDIKKSVSNTQKDTTHYRVSDVKNLDLSGLSALQYSQETLKTADSLPGCYLHTYFQQNNEVHEITLGATSCQTLLKYKDIYDTVVNNFQFTNK